MKNTLWIHIVIGVLTIVPLILFNIRKIWVRRPPDPVTFKLSRCIVIAVICLFIGTFLTASYHTAMNTRYEIAVERLAQKHSEMLTGRLSAAEFRAFVVENGGEGVAASFDQAAADSDGVTASGDYTAVKFQFSNWLIPKYWEGKENYEQAEVLTDENPVYVRYVIDTGSAELTYAVRMRFADGGWKYDQFFVPDDGQVKDIKMNPGGKWYSVKA